jgi:hypothetical protein
MPDNRTDIKKWVHITLEKLAIEYTRGRFYYLWLNKLAISEDVSLLELEKCCMEQC